MDMTSHPKILQMASGDLWAGAEAQLYTLTKTLHSRMNIPVSVVLLNHGVLEQKLREAGVPVIILDEAKLNSAQILVRLYRTIRTQRPDIIHTHRHKENILGSIAGLLAGNIASVRTLHGAPEHPPKWWQFLRLAAQFTEWLTGRYIQKRIIAVTDSLVGIISQSYPLRMISVIENGIDVESMPSSSSLLINNPDCRNSNINIGLAGRLVPVKRVDLFIRMAQHISEQNPKMEYCFRVFGDGPLDQELRSLANNLHMENTVLFEGHCENMASRLGELDILVMTSDNEGLPMIMLEAMVMRIPIVAHAAGGMSRLLDYGKCGLLVSDHNPEGYAHAVMQLLADPALRTKLADMAFDRVNLHYSAAANATAYLEIYSEVRTTQ